MLSARTIYGEIFDNDEALGLFCSIAASGEAQGGWENGKIAALVPGSQVGLAAKIARHGADEDKHGRIFNALLCKRGLEPVAVPADTDYTMQLEAAGIGLAHARLRREEELTQANIVTYLAHSRVTEQRASEQMRALLRHARDRPDIGRAVRVISLTRTTIWPTVTRSCCGWPRPKAVVLAAGIRGAYAYERLGGWRRMVSLRRPARRNARGGPVPAQAGHA